MPAITQIGAFDHHGNHITAGHAWSFAVTHVSPAHAVSHGPQTWLTVKGMLSGGGRHLAVGVYGTPNGVESARLLRFTPEAYRYIAESVRTGRGSPLPGPTPIPIDVHINVHDGTSVITAGPTSLLLNPSGHATSLVTFVKSRLPNTPNVQNALNSPPPRRPVTMLSGPPTAAAFGTHHLPTELGLMVTNFLPLSSLPAFSLVNRASHAFVQPEITATHDIVHAGTQLLTDHLGNPVIGNDGLPLRTCLPVLGHDGNPLVDANGDRIWTSNLADPAYERFFEQPLDQRPPINDATGQPLRDINGDIVRQLPILNAHYYQTALNTIATALPPSAQPAALRSVTDYFRAFPIPEYQPRVTIFQDGTVSVRFRAHLVQALTSNHEIVRGWALARICDVIKALHQRQNASEAACERALAEALLRVPHYQVINPLRTTATYGPYHKAMLVNPDVSVRLLGSAVTDAIIRRHNITRSAAGLNALRQNRVNDFRSVDAHGQVVLPNQHFLQPIHEVQVSASYDSWLAPRLLDERRANLEDVIDAMQDAAPAADRHAIARGFAKFLVKNLANQPLDVIEHLLYSEQVLHRGQNYFARARTTLVHELGQPGPNGSLPAGVVTGVATRLRIADRNDWAKWQYQAWNMDGLDFANYASRNRVDLVDMAVHAQAPALQLAMINQYVNELASRNLPPPQITQLRNEAQQFMDWLRTNVNPAAAPR